MDRATSLTIGNCRILLDQRVVLIEDRMADLGSRALALLLCLAERPGHTISNEELLKAVWPRSIVEDSSLRAQVAKLRRKLSHYKVDALILNHSGQGYSLVVAPTSDQSELSPRPSSTFGENTPLRALFGREVEMANVIDLLASHQVVTLTGPSGVGKSALACEVMRHREEGGGAVRYIDIEKPQSPKITRAIIARTAQELGLVRSERRRAASELRPLLILDHLEHTPDLLSSLSDDIGYHRPPIEILLCCSQPLHMDGGCTVRLKPLEVPLLQRDTPCDFRQSPAETLFYALAKKRRFNLLHSEAVKKLVRTICSQVEGFPLGIHLAVAQLEHMKIEGLARELVAGFDVLVDESRARPHRHTSVQASYEFQYALLTPRDRLLLERLSIFRGDFPAEAAIAVAAIEDLTERNVFAGLGSLCGHSVLATSSRGELGGYRLPATFRTYAFERLQRGSGYDAIVRRYAAYILEQVTKRSDSDQQLARTDDALIPDLLHALEWCFSAEGDAETGLALVLAAVPVLFKNSLLDPCRRHVERALERVGSDKNKAHQIMRLHAALGGAYMNIRGAGAKTRSAWQTVMTFSGQLRDIDYRLRSLWGFWVDSRNQGNYGEASKYSKRFKRLSRLSDDMDVHNNSLRMEGITLFYTGDLQGARVHLENLVCRPSNHDISSFQFDQRISANTFLAQILFIQGFTDRALAIATSTVGSALTLNHSASVCYALAEGACPVAWYAEDFSTLGRFVCLLLEASSTPGLEAWRTVGLAYQGILNLAQKNEGGFETLRDALASLGQGRLSTGFPLGVARYAGALQERGREDEARCILEDAVAGSKIFNEKWCQPELLRLKALSVVNGSALKAVELLQHAYELADQQGALAWQLRAAVSMGELQEAHKMPLTALPLALYVLEKYPEPGNSVDCRRARELLERHVPCSTGMLGRSLHGSASSAKFRLIHAGVS